MRPCLKHINILYTYTYIHYTLPVHIYTHSHTLGTYTINTHIQCRYTVYTHCKHMLHTYVIHIDIHNCMYVFYTYHTPTLHTLCTHSIHIICRHCTYTLYTYTHIFLSRLTGVVEPISCLLLNTSTETQISPVVWTLVFLLVLSGS